MEEKNNLNFGCVEIEVHFPTRTCECRPRLDYIDLRAICLWITEKTKGIDEVFKDLHWKEKVEALNRCPRLKKEEVETQEWSEI